MTAFGTGLFLVISSVTVTLPPPDVTAIMQPLKQVFQPALPGTRKVTISVYIQQGDKSEKTQWIAGQAFKKLPDGNHILTVILAPARWRGYTFLVHERGNEPSSLQEYLPALGTAIPKDGSGYFFDTDFTYADLGFAKFPGQPALLGKEDHQGVLAFKVERQIPLDAGTAYSRLVTWFAVDSLLPLQRNYYDLIGKLWKTELFSHTSPSEGVPTPLHVTMQDLVGNTNTDLTFENVRYGVDIPDTLLDPHNLAQAVDSPLWRAYISPTAKE